MRKQLISLTAVLMLGAVPSITLGADEGFFVGLEAWYVEPGNTLPVSYHNPNRDSDGIEGGTEVESPSGAELSPRIFVGYQTADSGRFVASLWFFDNDEDSLNLSPDDEGFTTTLAHRWYSHWYGDYIAQRAETDAFVLDLMWENDCCQTGKFSATTGFGLRYFDYERKLVVTYASTDGSYDPSINECIDEVTLLTDANGIGVRGTAAGRLQVSDNFALRGGVEAALLYGSRDFTYTHYYYHSDMIVARYNDDNSGQIFAQLGADLGAVVTVGGNFDISFGYRLWSWLDVDGSITSLMGGDNHLFQYADVGLTGPYLGFSWANR